MNIDVDFYDNAGTEAIKFIGGSVDETTDYLSADRNKCVAIPCYSKDTDGPKTPGKGPGSKGTPGLGGSVPVELPIITPNVVVTDGSSPFSVEPIKSDVMKENFKVTSLSEANQIEISTMDNKENKMIKEVSLLDVNGRLIDIDINITEERTVLSNFEVTPGIYYVKIVTQDGGLETHKMFIN